MACHSLTGHLTLNRQAAQVILINVLGLPIISTLHSGSFKYFDISFSEKSDSNSWSCHGVLCDADWDIRLKGTT